MEIPKYLLENFAKITNSTDEKTKEKILYGTVVEYDGELYVKLDGSEIATPAESTVSMKPGERVTGEIKNHNLTVTGNLSDPSASSDETKEVSEKIDQFGLILATKVNTEELSAERARIDNLVAATATIQGDLTATNVDVANLLEAKTAIINDLEAEKAKITNIEGTYVKTVDLESKYATIENLEANYATIDNINSTYTKTVDLEAKYAKIADIEADYATMETLESEYVKAASIDGKYANIDFSNIGEAAITKIFSDSGIIKDLIVSEGTVTGELVGVTIKGDLIEGNTIKADKLVVKGSDGLYYKLNLDAMGASAENVPTDTLHGSVITANSITAEKIQVDDLVAFDATIGGFNITNNSIYSGVKSSVDNTTSGLYMDNNGQMCFGDADNYIKYYEEDGVKKLAISADQIYFGSNKTNLGDAIDNLPDTSDIETRLGHAETAIITNANAIELSVSQTELEETLSGYTTVETMQSSIKQLSDSLKFSVSDGENTTEMIQTENGWVFNTKDLHDKVNSIDNSVSELNNYISIKKDGGKPCIELGETSSDSKVSITNEDINFNIGSYQAVTINNQDGLIADKSYIKEDLREGNFHWVVSRDRKHLRLTWKDDQLYPSGQLNPEIIM